MTRYTAIRTAFVTVLVAALLVCSDTAVAWQGGWARDYGPKYLDAQSRIIADGSGGYVFQTAVSGTWVTVQSVAYTGAGDFAGAVTGSSFTADANGDVTVSGTGAHKGSYIEAADGTTALTLSDSTGNVAAAGQLSAPVVFLSPAYDASPPTCAAADDALLYRRRPTGTGNRTVVGFAGHTDGRLNFACGFEAGNAVTTGDSNVFIGYQAGRANTIGASNAFVGHQTGYSNVDGYSNAFIGIQAGYSNIGGNSNAFLGYRAGITNTYGSSNAFVGYRAGELNATGNSNAFIGIHAGFNQQTGSNNVSLCTSAAYGTAAGSWNDVIAVGKQACEKVSDGAVNIVAVGKFAGHAVGAGSDQLYLGGYDTDTSTSYPLHVNLEVPAADIADGALAMDLNRTDYYAMVSTDKGAWALPGSLAVATSAAGTLLTLDDGQEGGTRWTFSSTRNGATDIDGTITFNDHNGAATMRYNSSAGSWEFSDSISSVGSILGAPLESTTYLQLNRNSSGSQAYIKFPGTNDGVSNSDRARIQMCDDDSGTIGGTNDNAGLAFVFSPGGGSAASVVASWITSQEAHFTQAMGLAGDVSMADGKVLTVETLKVVDSTGLVVTDVGSNPRVTVTTNGTPADSDVILTFNPWKTGVAVPQTITLDAGEARMVLSHKTYCGGPLHAEGLISRANTGVIIGSNSHSAVARNALVFVDIGAAFINPSSDSGELQYDADTTTFGFMKKTSGYATIQAGPGYFAGGVSSAYVGQLNSPSDFALRAYPGYDILLYQEGTGAERLRVSTGTAADDVTLTFTDKDGSGSIVYEGASDTIQFVDITAVVVPSAAAAPTGITTPTGAMYFDTTAVKPLWWSGTVWVDGAGTQVYPAP